MEDLALVRLAVLSSYLGRLRSPGEYARRELAGWLDGAWLLVNPTAENGPS